VVSRGQACVIRKLLANRLVSKETIKMALMKWWKPQEKLVFQGAWGQSVHDRFCKFKRQGAYQGN
jgi:hypothetical protein